MKYSVPNSIPAIEKLYNKTLLSMSKRIAEIMNLSEEDVEKRLNYIIKHYNITPANVHSSILMFLEIGIETERREKLTPEERAKEEEFWV